MIRGLLIALALSLGPTVSNSFARFAYALVLPAMRGDLGLSYSEAGSLNTANAFGYLLGAVLIRALVGTLGNRALFGVGMVVTALALLATGLTHDLALLATMRILAGVGGAAVFICGGALSGNVFPDRPQLATTTISIYFGGAGIGLLLCGAPIPWLLDARGDAAWPLVWQAMGWVSLAMAAASIWAALRIDEPARAAGAARWRIGPFVPELAAYLMFALGYIGYMTFIIAWARENGAGTATVVALWLVLGLATLVAPAVWSRPLERWPGGRPMAATMAVLALGALLPLLSAAPVVLVVSAALFGLAMFSVPASASSLIKHGLPKPAWGSAMATFTSLFAAGQIVGPVATGWLADRLGSLLPGLGASVLVLLLGVALALAQRDLRSAPATH